MDKWDKKRVRDLDHAISEAKRFTERAKAAIMRLNESDDRAGSKENAAAKRASMDLSNALVAVRGR